MVCHVRLVEDEDDDEHEDDWRELWGGRPKCAMGKGNRGRVFVLLGQ